MKQQEFEKRVEEAREIQERAMAMLEESTALAEVDFKRSNELFLESVKLWQKGCEMFNQVVKEAFNSKNTMDHVIQSQNTVKKNKNMVIDYYNRHKAISFDSFEITAAGEINFHSEKVVENQTFKNFPNIHLEGATFKNCRFENCQEVETYQCKIENCTFLNISDTTGHYTDFIDCTFTQCCSQGPTLTIDGEGKVYGCIFDNIIALGNDGYIIYSSYNSKEDVQMIKNCKFINCKAESANGLYTYCTFYALCSRWKTQEIENVDISSCDFNGGGSIIIGEFNSNDKDN